ncbi:MULTISPECIES: MFS transporter [Mameliella]|uniref:MFS transporter n=1 Tax=Mameliella TaxID=1434019 RepID=UPI000B52BC41|nr:MULTISPECIES: MFS transporter [Mameliella]MCR9271940.1 MFS transporter [Paracoccaceae bacterium]OWV62851.1 hypothetical protein CDZ98_01325 [Mameliella alba]
MLDILTDRTYRHLFVAQVVALLGTGLATVALGLLAFDLAGASAGMVLGTIFTIKMVAYVGIAPVAGAFADRVNRRALLVGLDTLRAAVALCLPFVTETWQIYALVFVLQSASTAFTPTFQATIPDVLPEEARYTRALSLSRLAYDQENIVSPTLAALLRAVMSYNMLFLGTVAGFAASALLAAVWLGYSAVLTPSGRLLKRSAHPEDRPAVFAALFPLSHACWLLTYPLSGWLMTALGTVPALIGLAVLGAVGLVASLRLWPGGDPVEVPHRHDNLPLDHPHLQGRREHSHALVIDDQHPRWGAKF